MVKTAAVFPSQWIEPHYIVGSRISRLEILEKRARKTCDLAHSCLTVMRERPIRSAVVSVVCYAFFMYSIAPVCFYCEYNVSKMRCLTLAIVVCPPFYDVPYSH